MASILQHLKARYRLWRGVRFWYHPLYDPPSLVHTARTMEIIPNRGGRLLSHLISQKLVKRSDLRTFRWASLRDLKRFHSEAYLESVSDPEVLGRIYGLEPHEIRVDELLAAQRWAVSGTLAMVQSLLKKESQVGFNFGGGFHHAEPEQGSGFCVYNDIGIAVAKARRLGFRGPITIVDLDYHQGNGNNVGFVEDPSVSIFSIHGSVWTHVEGKNHFNYHLSDKTKDDFYLSTLQENLPKVVAEHRPELILYLAGNDVLKRDPLGGFDLSIAGLFNRDRWVLDLATEYHIPLGITMAGGYRWLSLMASLNFLYYLLGYENGINIQEEESLHVKFKKIAKSINPIELQKDEAQGLKFTEEDIWGSLDPHAPQTRLLGYYSSHGVEMAMDRYGLFEKGRELGWRDFRVSIDAADPSRQLIRVEARPQNQPEGKLLLIAELVLRIETRHFPIGFRKITPLRLLCVEWLLLQDPRWGFSLQNPKFPGQEYPGLGLSKEIQELLVQMCHRLQLDGILNRPSFYHIAAGATPIYTFLDPKEEGRFQALQKVLRGQELVMATRLVAEHKLQWGNGELFKWLAAEQVFPISEPLKEYFLTKAYREEFAAEKEKSLQNGLHVRLTSSDSTKKMMISQ